MLRKFSKWFFFITSNLDIFMGLKGISQISSQRINNNSLSPLCLFFCILRWKTYFSMSDLKTAFLITHNLERCVKKGNFRSSSTGKWNVVNFFSLSPGIFPLKIVLKINLNSIEGNRWEWGVALQSQLTQFWGREQEEIVKCI